MTDFTTAELTVLDMFLSAGSVYLFATDHRRAIKWQVETQHGTAVCGWIAKAKRDGIHWEDRETLHVGIITWVRVRAAVAGVATPESITALGAAVEAHRVHSCLSTEHLWAEQRGEAGPITDREAHNVIGSDLYWQEWQLGYEIKKRWFESAPVEIVQLDLFDLIGASA